MSNGWTSPGAFDPPSTGLDTGVPHIARVYDYWLGGKDNFAADREVAELIIAAGNVVTENVRANRAFLGRAAPRIQSRARRHRCLPGSPERLPG